jgi:hypothetical protein
MFKVLWRFVYNLIDMSLLNLIKLSCMIIGFICLSIPMWTLETAVQVIHVRSIIRFIVLCAAGSQCSQVGGHSCWCHSCRYATVWPHQSFSFTSPVWLQMGQIKGIHYLPLHLLHEWQKCARAGPMLSTPGTQPYTVPHDGDSTRGAKLFLKEFFSL